MKKFKTKIYDYRRCGNHIKLIFQWTSGGDVETTLIVLAGKQKHLSGVFSIASTKEETIKKLWEICCERYLGSAREVVNLLPWHNTIKCLKEYEARWP